jgi:hypothetical protein
MALAPEQPQAGPTRGFTLDIAVIPGYHNNSDQPASPELIATSLSLEAPPGISLRQAQYPASRRLQVAGDAQPWLVWDGKFQIKALVSIDPGLAPGEYPLTFNLFYQACNQGICHMPENARASFTLTAP